MSHNTCLRALRRVSSRKVAQPLLNGCGRPLNPRLSPAESSGRRGTGGSAVAVVPVPGGVCAPQGTAGGSAPKLPQPAGLLHQTADTEHSATGKINLQTRAVENRCTIFFKLGHPKFKHSDSLCHIHKARWQDQKQDSLLTICTDSLESLLPSNCFGFIFTSQAQNVVSLKRERKEVETCKMSNYSLMVSRLHSTVLYLDEFFNSVLLECDCWWICSYALHIYNRGTIYVHECSTRP